jgi:hypothetical protein
MTKIKVDGMSIVFNIYEKERIYTKIAGRKTGRKEEIRKN